MSTLNVANITDGTTTVATEYVVNGSAKAWANYNGTATAAPRDSLNVSSLTDRTSGAQSINLTNSFASFNQAYFAGGRISGATTIAETTYELSSASAMEVITFNSTFSNIDALYVSIVSYGDLA